VPSGTGVVLQLHPTNGSENEVDKNLYRELKLVFFDWCSVLSLDECVSNLELIAEIEKVERLLIEATA
jgi:hypothetical protein